MSSPDEQSLVIVGASLAGLRAAEAARKAGFGGRVVLVGAEDHLPYDRPPLSKAFLAPGPEPLVPEHRTQQELDGLSIELRLGTAATGLDVDASEVHLGRDRLPYQALVVATGSTARHLPGERLDGVHGLRTLDDARAIRRSLDRGARVVVVGAGFIGSEVASAARARGLPVTVIEAGPAPLARAVGPEAARLCAAMHDAAGTDLRCGNGVTELLGEDGRVAGVRLADGEEVAADLVVAGIGAEPAVGWLEQSGLEVDDGVRCDDTLRTTAADVWAAGDVAQVHDPFFGSVRLEHWTSAADQGRVAGTNAATSMLGGDPHRFESVPYFWSDVYGHKLQMVGLPQGQVAEVIGSPEGPWLVLHGKEGRLSGALSLDLPGRIMKFRALIARGASVDDARELAHRRPLPRAGQEPATN